MQVYAYDHNGFYMGPTTAQKDPMQPGKFLLPAHATETAPPVAPEGQAAKWNGTAWALAEHPAVTAAKAKAAADAAAKAKLDADNAAAEAEAKKKRDAAALAAPAPTAAPAAAAKPAAPAKK